MRRHVTPLPRATALGLATLVALVAAVPDASAGRAPEDLGAAPTSGSAASVAEPVPHVGTRARDDDATAAEPVDALPTIPDHGAIFATTRVDQLQVFDAPREHADEVVQLSEWSYYGSPRTLMIVDTDRDADGSAWFEVLLPIEPNGSSGWIRADDVVVDATTMEVHVDLTARLLRLLDDGETVLEADVVIGHPATPTPTGTFYVTDPVDLRLNPTGVYGAFAIGISSHSEVLDEFFGGPAQIAIHGTDQPDLVGQAVSNGCIRLPNDTVLELAERIDLGTPVHVHA